MDMQRFFFTFSENISKNLILGLAHLCNALYNYHIVTKPV